MFLLNLPFLSFSPVLSAYISSVFPHIPDCRIPVSSSLLSFVFSPVFLHPASDMGTTCTQYSKFGLTNALYNSSTVSFSLLIIVLLIIPSTLFAFFAASAHCLDGFVLLFMITPKSLSSSVSLKIIPPIPYCSFLLFLPMCITEHFSVLNIIFHSSAHLCSPSISLLSTSASSFVSTPPPIFVSSANFDIFDFIPPPMSFIKTTKSNGPRTDPCGTPLSTLDHFEYFPLIPTFCLLSLNHCFSQFNKFPPIPLASNFFPNLLCGTLSKAFAKSRYNMSTAFPSSSFLYISSKNSSRFVRHDLPFVNPCWLLTITLYFS